MAFPPSLGSDKVVGGEFKILRRIGEGGMGVVYAALQLTTGHERALKIMHAPFAVDTRARERFEQEARIGAGIDSDHIVQVVGAGIDEQTHAPWLAMELLQGQDLERHIQTRGPMPLADTALVIDQVIHALSAAHEVGVVHRDIKPDNVFLSRSRVVGVPFMVKILDFGIAKLRSNVRSATVAVGTPGYMAPEQSGTSEEIGPQADIWPLGLIVFRMLTGSFFWRAAADGEGLAQLWRESLVDPIGLASERAEALGCPEALPPGFDEWFASCVERDLSLRFPSVQAAGQAFAALMRKAGVVTGSEGSYPSVTKLTTAIEEVGRKVEAGGTLVADSASLITHVDSSPAQVPTAGASYRVSFREKGERVVALANRGDSLLDVSLNAGVPHYHACGGNARCSTCRVVVLKGSDKLSPRTDAEAKVAERRKWPKTTRLACQAHVLGPCVVRRLVVDPNDASMADMRRSTAGGATRSSEATALVLRLDGIDEVLADGFPDDAIHVLERCLAPLAELLDDNSGQLVGLEGTTALARFDAGPEGVRRALRVALRASARIRRINPYLLKHFGVQVNSSAGLGGGILLEGQATTSTKSGRVLMGTAVREARKSCDRARRGQVLAPRILLAQVGLDLVRAPGPPGYEVVLDFAKSDVVYLVQTTFDRLGAKAPEFAAAFYDELFEIHPAAIALFENSDMDRQQEMLVQTLAVAVKGLDDFSRIEAVVRELGERHVDYGATLKDYKYVGQALLTTLERYLGDAFTPEAELAWREVYTTLVRTMTGG